MILLLDADIIIYQAACKAQEDYLWDDSAESHIADVELAKEILDSDVAAIMEATKTTEVLMALSSSPNFRYSILPTYKHNRKDKQQPLLRYDLIQYVKDNYPFKQYPTLEGDDIMGILMTRHKDKYICASTDKDMRQIPGLHYNFKKEEFFDVTEKDGDLWFYTQVLTGDTADGYSGCPGVGKVKAEKILSCPPEDYWSTVVSTYESKGLDEEDALQQARVARILRASDYDFKNKQIILWSP